MNHLVLVAYPIMNTFTADITTAYTEQLHMLGHDSHTVDLYQVGFNSVLNENDDGDDSDELNAIRGSDVITLLYPLWWLSMPALMQGYLNRVFQRSNSAVHNGFMCGKKAVLITVSGASLTSLVQTGRWTALHAQQNSDVLHSAGFDLVEHMHFSDITPSLTKQRSEEYVERVRDFACQQFGNY